MYPMKPYRAEDQLINKLMEETFKESGSKKFSNDSSDLLSYFNTKSHKAKSISIMRLRTLLKEKSWIFEGQV